MACGKRAEAMAGRLDLNALILGMRSVHCCTAAKRLKFLRNAT
jgi:hypothetical protein